LHPGLPVSRDPAGERFPGTSEPAETEMPLRSRINWPLLLCALYAAGVFVCWILIRFLGDRWWPATILLFAPRWPMLLPLLVLLPWAYRRGKLIWLPCITGLFIIGPLMGFQIPWRHLFSGAPSTLPIRLLVCNVHLHELNAPALDAYILASNPQVVALEDYSGRNPSHVLTGPTWNVYRLGEILLATHYPIERVHDFHLERVAAPDDIEKPRRVGAAACFDLRTPNGLLHLVDLHLASPHMGFRTLRHHPGLAAWRLEANSDRRWNESQVISDWLSTQAGPVILAGDFNTPAESVIYRHFWSDYTDAFPSVRFGFGYTHLTSMSELRIDHVLTAPGVSFTGCQIGPPCGTPHRPFVVDCTVSPERLKMGPEH
jgi:vancomycin resistance protein VanJ